MNQSGPICPLCSKPIDPGFRPFCSKRCADIDLHRWFSGHYVIPAEKHEAGEDDGLPNALGDDAS